MKHYGRIRKPKGRPEREREAHPADIPAGLLRGRITIELDGMVHEVTLRQPGCSGARRPRSDTLAAGVGAQWLVMSLRAAALAAVAQVPRQLTRAELREYL